MSSVLCGKPTPDGKTCRRRVKTPGAPCGAAHPEEVSPTGAPPSGTPVAAGPDPLAAGPVRLPGTRWDPAGFEVTPGVIDDAARKAFTSGHCLGLARAVRRRTGWQMIWLGRPECAYDEDCLGEYELGDGSSACQHTHVAVIAPDGRVVDINGSSTVADAVVALGECTREEVHEMGDSCRGPIEDADAEVMAGDRAWLDTPPEVADSFVGPVLAQAGYPETLDGLAADRRGPVRSAAARHPGTSPAGRAAAGLLGR